MLMIPIIAWVANPKAVAPAFSLGTLLSSPMRVWIFLPLGFIVAAISGMIGEAGPVLNPFFLNYGVDKEAMIATKSVNSFFMQLTKIGSYVAFGAMAHAFWPAGIASGSAATLARWVGKTLLHRMDGKQFRRTVVVVMVIAGALMLWQERSLFMRWAR
jgi:uncharacterized membrane protein YfcA